MFIKYPKIKILGDKSNEGILTTPGKVVIQEKIDGANFAFYVEDDILCFCSRNQNLTDSEQIEETGIPQHWKGIEPILTSWQKDPTQFEEDFRYVGESMQRHTIKYTDDIPGFIGFDILHIDTMTFLDWKEAKIEFEKLNLPFINVISEINVDEINTVTIDHLKSLYQKSAYRDGMAEGIVIKRYDMQIFAKIVDDSFKEKNREVFGHPPPKQTNEDKITRVYVTDARIRKIIHKLHDDGHEIEMPMMKILYKFVIRDLLEEEIIEIYENYNSIDFKRLNKSISKKCAVVLKKVIMNGYKYMVK